MKNRFERYSGRPADYLWWATKSFVYGGDQGGGLSGWRQEKHHIKAFSHIKPSIYKEKRDACPKEQLDLTRIFDYVRQTAKPKEDNWLMADGRTHREAFVDNRM